MGLVIQAPTEAALLSGILPAATDAPAPATDIFAALLQSLVGGAEGVTVAANAAGAPAAAVPLPVEAPADATEGDDPAGAALAAAVAALQLLPQVAPTEAPGNATAVADGAPAAGSQAVSSGPLMTSIEPGVAAAADAGDEQPRAVPATPAAEAPAAEAPAATEAPASSSPGPVPAALVAVASNEPPVALSAAASEPAAEPLEHVDRPPAADDPPPAEAGETPAITDEPSVVRFVGNAHQENHGHDTAAGHGRADAPKSGNGAVQPRASAQGIAHASVNSPVGQLRTESPTVTTDQPVAAPAAPELPQPVQQVSRAVLDRVGRGDGEARIHLDPVELGEVTISVKTEGNHVRVEIHAERAEVMNLLRDHSADLSNLLGSRGLNLSDVYVGLGGQGARDPQAEQQRGERPINGRFASILGTDEAPSVERHNRLRSAYNPDGAHSYRV